MFSEGGILGVIWLDFVVRWSIFRPLGGVFGALFFPANLEKTLTIFTTSLVTVSSY